MNKFISYIILVVASISTFSSTGFLNAQISLTGVEGIWTGTSGGTNVNGIGTSQVQWGITNGQQSGYIFAPSSLMYPVNITPGVSFDLGIFTHNNFVIRTGTSIQGATLATNFTFLVDGEEVNLSKVYGFAHNETLNIGGGNCCDDIVTAINNTPFTESFIIGDYMYDFEISGFRVNGELLSQFETVENQENTAVLVAEVTRVAIPEPSTYLLLSSMLIMVILYRRKAWKKV